jgi:hypothetical protein
MTDRDELRELIREVIRDQLGTIRATESVETVNLSSDAELAAFVARLLDLDPGERDDLRAGRKRFRLAATPASVSMAPSSPLERVAGAIDQAGSHGTAARRIERGAVTEAMIRDAARDGQRLVLGRGAVLTPLARDRARASGVAIEKER